jgi:hypothetical protein
MLKRQPALPVVFEPHFKAKFGSCAPLEEEFGYIGEVHPAGAIVPKRIFQSPWIKQFPSTGTSKRAGVEFVPITFPQTFALSMGGSGLPHCAFAAAR